MGIPNGMFDPFPMSTATYLRHSPYADDGDSAANSTPDLADSRTECARKKTGETAQDKASP